MSSCGRSGRGLVDLPRDGEPSPGGREAIEAREKGDGARERAAADLPYERIVVRVHKRSRILKGGRRGAARRNLPCLVLREARPFGKARRQQDARNVRHLGEAQLLRTAAGIGAASALILSNNDSLHQTLDHPYVRAATGPRQRLDDQGTMEGVIDSWDAKQALDLANIRFQLMYVFPSSAQYKHKLCAGSCSFNLFIPRVA
jgi:hypothetical protein